MSHASPPPRSWPLMRARLRASTPAVGRHASGRPAQTSTAISSGPSSNAICLNRGRTPRRHVTRLFERVAQRKGHQKAIGAVARHLAEATYWILTKQQPYREPTTAAVSSTGDQRG